MHECLMHGPAGVGVFYYFFKRLYANIYAAARWRLWKGLRYKAVLKPPVHQRTGHSLGQTPLHLSQDKQISYRKYFKKNIFTASFWFWYIKLHSPCKNECDAVFSHQNAYVVFDMLAVFCRLFLKDIADTLFYDLLGSLDKKVNNFCVFQQQKSCKKNSNLQDAIKIWLLNPI